jgi:hypothetical protein
MKLFPILIIQFDLSPNNCNKQLAMIAFIFLTIKVLNDKEHSKLIAMYGKQALKSRPSVIKKQVFILNSTHHVKIKLVVNLIVGMEVTGCYRKSMITFEVICC